MEDEPHPLDTVSAWVGRKVRRTDDAEEFDVLGPAVVLAVDDTAYAPSAWIRYSEMSEYPAYRSMDLSDLVDIETDHSGPRWGTDGWARANAAIRERAAKRISS